MPTLGPLELILAACILIGVAWGSTQKPRRLLRGALYGLLGGIIIAVVLRLG